MKNLAILLICATLTGCSPVYYVPNTQNVPVIKEKGQTNYLLASIPLKVLKDSNCKALMD